LKKKILECYGKVNYYKIAVALTIRKTQNLKSEGSGMTASSLADNIRSENNNLPF
jgi:hypothetical protein